MEKTELVVFNKANTKEILKQFGFRTQTRRIGSKNKEFVIREDNEPAFCPACSKEISVKRLGTIAHGSRVIFCDNPLCFSTWVAQNKVK
ncbi:hypothetical protein D4R78_06105 [bacterium]|nr:MAG: hypothetical protein D4R78_06105 [bacterium]